MILGKNCKSCFPTKSLAPRVFQVPGLEQSRSEFRALTPNLEEDILYKEIFPKHIPNPFAPQSSKLPRICPSAHLDYLNYQAIKPTH